MIFFFSLFSSPPICNSAASVHHAGDAPAAAQTPPGRLRRGCGHRPRPRRDATQVGPTQNIPSPSAVPTRTTLTPGAGRPPPGTRSSPRLTHLLGARKPSASGRTCPPCSGRRRLQRSKGERRGRLGGGAAAQPPPWGPTAGTPLRVRTHRDPLRHRRDGAGRWVAASSPAAQDR